MNIFLTPGPPAYRRTPILTIFASSDPYAATGWTPCLTFAAVRGGDYPPPPARAHLFYGPEIWHTIEGWRECNRNSVVSANLYHFGPDIPLPFRSHPLRVLSGPIINLEGLPNLKLLCLLLVDFLAVIVK